jgi:cytochrome oxidase Cu insertion factor (SCO1/SenC/PrrC family)
MGSVEMTRGERWALTALAAIGVISAGWWAAALWPLPTGTPEWVERARTACFGRTDSGLPDAGGWILLIGSPPAMVAVLAAIAGGDLWGGLRRLGHSGAGRMALASSMLLLVAFVAMAGTRVSSARAAVAQTVVPADLAPTAIDRPAPGLGLVDQHGNTMHLADLAGTPFLLAFAYGGCETICPIIVEASREGRADAGAESMPLLVITLDPWRDTPRRLPRIAEAWRLEAGDRVLGGTVDAVEAVIDDWGVGRERDLRTGEITHPSLVYLVDGTGRIAYMAAGEAGQVRQAIESLRARAG